MYYSEELIEEVRSRNDIVDVISGYVRLQKKGSSYFGLCPFHNEKSPSFSVSRQKQMYYCFGCGAGGNVITFLMEYENYSFQEALKVLAERVGIELPEQESSKEAKKRADTRTILLEINKAAAQYYYVQLRSPQGAHALTYLKNRELSDDTMKTFGLGYSNKYSNDLYQYLKSKGYIIGGGYQNIDGVSIYAEEILENVCFDTGRVVASDNTVAVHHSHASWRDDNDRKEQTKRYEFWKQHFDNRE